jgi:hypothetical protein
MVLLRAIVRCATLRFLFLTRLAANDIGDEGLRMLAEPLGKLTALRELDLGGTVLAIFA